MRRLGITALALLSLGCTPVDPAETIVLVTTTTIDDSGLLDTLAAAYHAAQDDYRLLTTAVGSGAALELGRRGDADILLTHDPTGEEAFMAAGHGVEQGPVMRSEFVLAGPSSDPAGVREIPELGAALDRIAATGAPFVSRGDDSGTHRRERELWRRAGREPPGTGASPDWYLEAGSGMAESLRVADQRGAYVLTELATLRQLEDRLDLELLVRPSPPERNPYRYTLPRDRADHAGARSFLGWLVGPGQDVIGAWSKDRFGERLFEPTAGRVETP